jgi:imidazole glycerol-phosphate synthase subunit HisF
LPRVRIIPVLLLKDGGLYKTINFKKETYVGDPVNTVKIFNEKGADELAILGFDVSKNKKHIDFKKLTEIAGEAFMPMSYGGGIKTFTEAKQIFDAGYEKIIINSTLFENPALIEQVGTVYGAQAVVAALDVKKNFLGKFKVYSHSGTKAQNFSPVEWAKKAEEYGAGEILLNAIDKDGTWEGYDEQLIQQVAHAVSIPVIACGGAGTNDDLKKAVQSGASAVAAGSMFVYQKKGKGVLISFPSEMELIN